MRQPCIPWRAPFRSGMAGVWSCTPLSAVLWNLWSAHIMNCDSFQRNRVTTGKYPLGSVASRYVRGGAVSQAAWWVRERYRPAAGLSLFTEILNILSIRIVRIPAPVWKGPGLKLSSLHLTQGQRDCYTSIGYPLRQVVRGLSQRRSEWTSRW